MFSSQTLVMKSMAGAKGSAPGLPDRPADVINEYIGHYCHSLVSLGYLEGSGLMRGYRLTPAGKKALKN